jgi:hypothetical protein
VIVVGVLAVLIVGCAVSWIVSSVMISMQEKACATGGAIITDLSGEQPTTGMTEEKCLEFVESAHPLLRFWGCAFTSIFCVGACMALVVIGFFSSFFLGSKKTHSGDAAE